jgi:hypothetical protein
VEPSLQFPGSEHLPHQSTRGSNTPRNHQGSESTVFNAVKEEAKLHVKVAKAKTTPVEDNYATFARLAATKLTPRQTKVLKAIGECESGFRMVPNKSGASSAYGIFQTLKVHDARAKKLGYSWRGESPEANIALAISLYLEQGTTPWNPSKHCWQEKIN